MLLTRRPEGSHLAGYWEFPGGKVEQGEDPEHALARELLEECGIEVRVLDVLDVTFHAYDEKDVLLLFYECELLTGQVRDLGVAEHVWCKPEQLGEYDFPPPDGRVLAKVRKGPQGPAHLLDSSGV